MTAFKQGVMALPAGGLPAGLLVFAETGFRDADAATEPTTNSITLKPVSDFESVNDKNERAIALFQEAGKVIQSPRCLNCHPVTDRPRQGDDMHLHEPPVQRGAGGMGAP